MTLPEEFTTYTRALMGEERFARFLGALDEPAPVSIRVNPFKAEATPETGADRVAWCRGGYLDSRPAFTFDPLLHAGAYYVQEASSMFIDHVVRQFVHAPVTALDLCAAPGGKTTCLRATLPEGSRLYSNEPHPKRAQILAENVVKFGHPEVVVTNNYAIDYQRAGLRFGLILADMPCSGEGMFRKDPESIGEWSPANVEKCAALQRSILADIWPCLLPGGLLIYSTCTFAPEEDEGQVAAFLQRHPEFTLADVLGLTLADLMHCHDSRQKDATPPVPLEDFFPMLRRQHTVDWRSVRTALLALSIALALWGIFACPGRLAVHWRTLSDGSLQADGWMSSLVIFPLFAGFEFLSLELWNNFEQTGYYRRWGEVNLFIIHAMSFGTPLTRLMRLVLDLLFFFCFGFLLPCCEAWLILLN